MTTKIKPTLIALMLVFTVAFVMPGLFFPATAAAAVVDVNTFSASEVGSDNATLNGDIADDNGLTIVEFGFYYGTDESEVSDGEDGSSDVQEADGDEDNFYLELTDLEAGETYYFMAYAIDDDDNITYGSVRTFTTDENSGSDVKVDTKSASEIGPDYATLNGAITDDNGLDIQEFGFYYGTDKDEVADGEDGSSKVQEADGVERDFYLDLKDLNAGKTYYYRAYAIDENDDIAYGIVKSFTLNKTETNPSVFTFGSNNYILRGLPQTMDVAPYAKDGRTYLPVRFVAYTMGLTDANIVWIQETRTVILTKDSTKVILMLGNRTMFSNGTPILMDTTPEAINGRTCLPIAWVASAFGYTATWDPTARTVTIGGSGISSKVDVTTLSASDISNDSATLNGEIADAKGIEIKEFGFYYGTNKSEVADGKEGDADVDEADGDKDKFYLDLSDLTSNKTYYFMAYAEDDKGNITYGAVKSFTTDGSGEVDVNTLSATGISADSATLKGEVADDGNLDIQEFGFYYGTNRSEVAEGEDGSSDVDEAGGDADDFYLDLEDLDSNETYYFMAYAIDENDDITYGSVKPFTTD